MNIFDAELFLTKEKIPFSERSVEGEIRLSCPECGREDHFYYNVIKNVGHCVRCGMACNAIGLVMRVRGVSRAAAEIIMRAASTDIRTLSDAKERLAAIINKEPAREIRRLPEPLPKGFKCLTPLMQSALGRRAIKYLEKRRIREDVWISRVGLSPEVPGYLIFPVWDAGGGQVYWTARDLLGFQVKAKNPAARGGFTSRRNVLLGIDRVDPARPVVVVEGPFDHLSTPNSVALLGKFMSAMQERLLRKVARSVVVCLDGGEAAAARIIAERVSKYLDVMVANLPEGKDPNDCISQIGAFISSAKKFNILEINA